MESHLLQMRGLKQLTKAQAEYTEKSHLLQMRGLKPLRTLWKDYMDLSHLLQMRGLKHAHGAQSLRTPSRIFYRCVD